MTVRVVHHLELVQIEIEQRQHPAAGTGSRQPLLELGDKSSPIGEPGERVLPGAALVLAFGAHGGDQHPVQPEAGHRHGGQIHRDLEEEDKHESGCPAIRAPGIVGPRLSTIIAPQSRGALKLRKQIPPTIAPADTQASVAATQSPVARLISAP
ncbi:hypothetical protein ACVWXL_008161 [Bradyrhizobium sp. GM22.5]